MTALAAMTASQALAGDYSARVSNLEAIARHCTGRWVSVLFQASATWQGLARLTPNGAEILINPHAAAADLGFILFHEVAHLALGHVAIIDNRPPADLAEYDKAARLQRLTQPERAAFEAVIDVQETEADSWAYDALAAYERRFGPFLEAI